MFSRKRIKVEIIFYQTTYASALETTGVFGEGGERTQKGGIVFDDFKVDLTAKRIANAIGPTATIKVYGVSQEHMNSITTMMARDNLTIGDEKKVRVSIDNGGGYITLFEGWITEAVPVYQTAPDCYIHIESSMAAFENSVKLPPISFTNSDVAISDMCMAVCDAYGVDCKTSDLLKSQPKVDGRKLQLGSNDEGLNVRVGQLCEAYGLNAVPTLHGYKFFMEGENGDGLPKYFNPNNMQGYPTYKNRLIQISTEDFSDLDVNDKFIISGSEIPYANAEWFVVVIQYHLQTWTPNGKWCAIVTGGPVLGEL